MSILTDGNLLPFRQFDNADVINLFALDGTGLNGMLVVMETGNQDPANSAGAYTTQAVASSWTNVTSYRYASPRKVRPSQAGDTAYGCVGITLHTVALNEENGIPLATLPYDKTLERGFVQTGFVVPILTRGVITLKMNNIIGTPFPGYAAVISTGGNGKIEAINPVGVVHNGFFTGGLTYTGSQIIGKFLSYSGSAFGGYAQIQIDTAV